MKKVKYIIFSIIAFLFLISSVYAASTIIDAVSVTYSTTKSGGTSSNVQGALDEIYEKIKSFDSSCDVVAVPKIVDGLVPVTISDDGTVKVVNQDDASWYNYCEKKWANAVILSSGSYTAGQTIPESAIESYLVWIPKYKYQLWNISQTAEKKAHSINIVFDEFI